MKKTMSLVVAAIAMVFGATSCGGAETPASIEKSIYAQFQKGDFEKGIELYFANLDNIDRDTPEEVAEAVKVFADKAKQTFEAKDGLKSYEVLEEIITEDGESARVTGKLIYGDGSEQEEKNQYVKKDGVWKIVSGK
ncbi:hypothetical protein SAMD00024442_21_55 [Candidatus Symbiothrix dinenymphae]|nr:hypothetical protein SAMD00024442_21_55 [Candidatus Symbiothrix dinenymphae]